LYKHIIFRTVGQWITFIHELPAEQHYLLEHQARCFAGLALVPRAQLEAETVRAVSKALAAGIDIIPPDKVAWSYIAESIASHFSVSRHVILARLDYDKFRSRAWLRGKGYL
jgi:hypothetical protein